MFLLKTKNFTHRDVCDRINLNTDKLLFLLFHLILEINVKTNVFDIMFFPDINVLTESLA